MVTNSTHDHDSPITDHAFSNADTCWRTSYPSINQMSVVNIALNETMILSRFFLILNYRYTVLTFLTNNGTSVARKFHVSSMMSVDVVPPVEADTIRFTNVEYPVALCTFELYGTFRYINTVLL